MSVPLRRTPLHDQHVALDARLVPFAGFEMPIQYSGIIDEHMAVRTAAGLFDVSHMGEVLVRGPHAGDFVQRLVTNDVEKLYDGRALYTVMCRPDGGIIDDLLVYRLDAETYLLVVNAANVEKDFAWMVQNNPMKAVLENISDEVALIALQGPAAEQILASVTDAPLHDLKYYHFLPLEPRSFFGSERALLSRTGYTGEPGFEIYCDPAVAPAVWEALLEAGTPAGLKPAGLGARDTLRIEAGYSLYGNDITEETNPLEAGLGWVTKLEKESFIGREALLAVRERGPARRLVGFVGEERGIPRAGYELLSDDGGVIGTVTSGTQSPVLGRGVGLGYVANDPAYTTPESRIGFSVRGRSQPAVVKRPPFHM